MIKNWDDLTPKEKEAAFFNLHHQDIGEEPGRWNKASLISRLTQTGLIFNPEIRKHFTDEGINLPPAVSSKEKVI